MGEIESQRNEKPVPIGQRPLPNIYIESEIGQADNSCAEERGEGGEVHSGGDQGVYCRGIGISELSYFDSGDEPWWGYILSSVDHLQLYASRCGRML